MSLRIAVAIGVARPGGLIPLPGAITAAQSYAGWAKAAGFDEVRLITDELGDVTIATLRQVFDEVFNTGDEIDHLAIFFAGHGVAPAADDQQLLLSRWDREDEQAIKLSAFRRLIGFHGPARVSFVLDACRTAARADMTLQGSGVVRKPVPGEYRDFEEDRFHAVDFARDAYMVGSEIPRCLFSSAMLWALAGRAPKAVAQDANGDSYVTSRGLAVAVGELMQQLASSHRLKQKPILKPGFLRDEYYTRVPLDWTPEDLPAPPAFADAGLEGSVASGEASEADFVLKLQRSAMRPVLPTEPPVSTRDVFQQESYPIDYESGAGVAVTGSEIVGPPVVSMGLTAVRPPRDPLGWWRLEDQRTVIVERPASLLVPVSRNFWLGAAAAPGHLASFIVGDQGASGLILRPIQAGPVPFAPSERDARLKTLLRRLAGGRLRRASKPDRKALLGGRAPDLVGSVLLAYLYDAAGDRELVRALAWGLATAGLPLPFDIVLLSDLPAKRIDGHLRLEDIPSPAADVVRSLGLNASVDGRVGAWVAGGFPWLRQGWPILEASDLPQAELLLELRRHLTPAPFTTLRAEGGERLAQHILSGDI